MVPSVSSAVLGSMSVPLAAWSARLCAVRCRITGMAWTSRRVRGLRRSWREIRVAPLDLMQNL